MASGTPSSRNTNGSAPTWSSCPCVKTIASMSFLRSRSEEKSGSTRSMPSISAVGNITPVSTITIRPSISTAVMFLPISPSPPRGRIRSFELTPGSLCGAARDQQPAALQRGANDGSLLGARGDHR